jgi:hypothetical protein
MGLPTDGLVVYAYTVLWITVSAGVILYNKWILNGFGFPFPVALTMIHMALCSALAFILVRVLKVVEGVNMTKDMYIRKIVPVAFLFSIVLWLGNSAYLYLSVAFIQMVKALMPCVVYLVGVSFKIETFKVGTMANMVILAIGIAVASYGELNFHAFGFTLLIASILAEAIRIVSIQLLLTASDIKLNSVTTLYYVSPACFVFLTLPFVFLELPAMLDAEDIKTNPLVLLSSAVLAFALNMSVYLLIGKTSALTMNVAGVIKDWLLICISSMLFDAPISSMQLLGYLLAFVAVCYYNYQKYLERAAKEKHLTAEASETMYDKCFHFPDTPETRRCILILLIFCAFAGILIREGPLSVTSSHFGTNLVDSILSTNSDVHKQITRRPPNDILVQRNKTISLPHNIVMDFNTAGVLSTTTLDEEWTELRVCAVTVILGNYESTLKQPAMPQTYKTWRLFAFTDRYDLDAGEWTVINTVTTPLQSLETCAKAEGAMNSPCENTNPMILGKYFKTQFHRIEIVQKSCDVVCWIDATVEINSYHFFEILANKAKKGENVLVFEHHRKGLISAEVQASLNIGRYDTTFAYGAPQSFQNVSRQYEHYLEEGFVEKWFVNDQNVDIVTSEDYGMWVTNFVSFDIRLAESKKFLDAWWHENLWHSSQDQVSFPYVAWKLHILPHNLPDQEITGNHSTNSLFKAHKHGE